MKNLVKGALLANIVFLLISGPARAQSSKVESYALAEVYKIGSDLLLAKASDFLESTPDGPIGIDGIEPNLDLRVLAILFTNKTQNFLAIWDYSKSQMLKVIPISSKDGPIKGMKFSPDYKYFVLVQTRGISVIETARWLVENKIRPPQGEAENSCEFAIFDLSVNATIVTGVHHQKPLKRNQYRITGFFEINVFKLEDGSLVRAFPFTIGSHAQAPALKSLAVAPDGDHVAIAYSRMDWFLNYKNHIEIYSLASGESMRNLIGWSAMFPEMSGLTYSPDQEFLFVMTGRSKDPMLSRIEFADTVHVWDVKGGQLLRRLPLHEGKYSIDFPFRRSFSISANGKWIAADSTRTRNRQNWDWHKFRMRDSVIKDKPTITIWDWRTKNILCQHPFDWNTLVREVKFIGSDQLLISRFVFPDQNGARAGREIIEIFNLK